MKFCRPRHLRRYLGLGKSGWTKLLTRAGLLDTEGAQWLSRAQAMRAMKFHFVMIAEKKPTKWKKNSRYQANRGLPAKVPPLRRTVRMSGQMQSTRSQEISPSPASSEDQVSTGR